jgi:hypothetical protein
MMRQPVIWQHDLGDYGNADLKLHRGATILHFAEHRGRMCVWEQHDVDEVEVEVRRFRIAVAGDPFPNLMPAHHVGTALFYGGDYVFHLFELEGPG